jgi:hypothetical protein
LPRCPSLVLSSDASCRSQMSSLSEEDWPAPACPEVLAQLSRSCRPAGPPASRPPPLLMRCLPADRLGTAGKRSHETAEPAFWGPGTTGGGVEDVGGVVQAPPAGGYRGGVAFRDSPLGRRPWNGPGGVAARGDDQKDVSTGSRRGISWTARLWDFSWRGEQPCDPRGEIEYTVID